MVALGVVLLGAVAAALTSQFEFEHSELPLPPEPTMPLFCAAPLA
jgi:hypothetical protein